MIRRGPESGYEFGAKKHYRKAVWATFRRHFHGHMAERRFALMPSAEGAEIDVAIKAGAREQNLCIIDLNPAIVATLKRKRPRLHAYGVSAARAAERIKADHGEIHGVNLDLCGGADKPLFETLRAWAHSRVIADQGLVAVTVLRGRERAGFGVPTFIRDTLMADSSHSLLHEFSRMTERDRLRLHWICTAVAGASPRDVVGKIVPLALHHARAPYGVTGINMGRYKSIAGHQTMMWVVMELHKNPCVCDRCVIAASAIEPPIDAYKAMRLQDFRLSVWMPLLSEHWGEDALMENIKRDMPQFVRRRDLGELYQGRSVIESMVR